MQLLALLPPDATVVGIDEHTALAADLDTGMAEVMGAGDVTVLRPDGELSFAPGGRFLLSEFGPFRWPEPDAGLPAEVWAEALAVDEDHEQAPKRRPTCWHWLSSGKPPGRRDWPRPIRLRQQAAALGWQVRDTPAGPW